MSRSLFVLALLAGAQAGMAAASAPVPAANAEGEIIPADEPASITAVTDHIRGTVQDGFDKTGHAFRDAHRKAHGCVHATFTVLGKLPSPLAQGLFATPKSYDAVIRYSNGSGGSNDDHSADARGMAVKVLGVSGPKLLDDEPGASTQDFVMINHPVFFVRNAKDYVGFMTANGLSAFGWFVTHPKETSILLTIGGKKVANPLNSQYWGMVPYKLGTEQMKYSAKPCAGQTFYETSDSANRMRENLTGHLASKGACFDFMVQTRTAPADMPIEDPTVEWKTSQSPFVNVARIEIPSQAPEDQLACEVRSYTPWHSIAEHRPLGGISRVRKTVYQTISTLRHSLNGQPRVEP